MQVAITYKRQNKMQDITLCTGLRLGVSSSIKADHKGSSYLGKVFHAVLPGVTHFLQIRGQYHVIEALLEPIREGGFPLF